MVQRAQWLANVILPSRNWHGKHSVKFGIDANKIDYDQLSNRRPFEVHRYAGSLARAVSFSGNPNFGRHNFEFGGFAQDRWSLNERASGRSRNAIRLGSDPSGTVVVSPDCGHLESHPSARLQVLGRNRRVFYDATHLDLLTRELDQQRLDTFYDEDGLTAMGEPVLSYYRANEHRLKPPFFLNWSLGWEQKLPRIVLPPQQFHPQARTQRVVL